MKMILLEIRRHNQRKEDIAKSQLPCRNLGLTAGAGARIKINWERCRSGWSSNACGRCRSTPHIAMHAATHATMHTATHVPMLCTKAHVLPHAATRTTTHTATHVPMYAMRHIMPHAATQNNARNL